MKFDEFEIDDKRIEGKILQTYESHAEAEPKCLVDEVSVICRKKGEKNGNRQ